MTALVSYGLAWTRKDLDATFIDLLNKNNRPWWQGSPWGFANKHEHTQSRCATTPVIPAKLVILAFIAVMNSVH